MRDDYVIELSGNNSIIIVQKYDYHYYRILSPLASLVSVPSSVGARICDIYDHKVVREASSAKLFELLLFELLLLLLLLLLLSDYYYFLSQSSSDPVCNENPEHDVFCSSDRNHYRL